jgi:hypothetical protein
MPKGKTASFASPRECPKGKTVSFSGVSELGGYFERGNNEAQK